MNKIDVVGWKQFKICELFITEKTGNRLQVPTGASIKRTELIEGIIPRITVTGLNNGVYGYYDCKTSDPNYRVFENFISVSFLGTVFYQEGKASLDMKVHCLKPVNVVLNKYTGEYLVTCLRKSLKDSRYSDQISSTVLPRLDIKLPVDKYGNPNFSYMETYMKNLEITVGASLDKLKTVNNFSKSNKLADARWKQFKIGDIFEATRPAARSQSNYETGEAPFVASGNYNNGVLKYLKPKEGEVLDKGNCITVSPIDGSAFYQKNDFMGRGGAGSSVILLYNPKLNRYNGLFIATVIRQVCSKYVYNNMANKDVIAQEIIKLPADEAGAPDYGFMTDYMINIELQAERNLQLLNMV